jgi:hypothetical protein
MARPSLSFLSVLLVLAALALSMPVKRDGLAAPDLDLGHALGPLSVSIITYISTLKFANYQIRVPLSFCPA